MRRLIAWGIPICWSIATAACNSNPVPRDDPGDVGIRVVAGGAGTDTAWAEPIQALVIEAAGVPAGTTVRFESADWPRPYLLLSALDSTSYQTMVATDLDQRRRAMVRIKYGSIPGIVHLRITIPEVGFQDSVPFTIRPGSPARITLGPADTTVIVGETVPLRTLITDQFDNPVEGTVTLAALDPFITISGFAVNAVAPGRGRIEARVADARDTIMVAVVPDGVLSGVASTENSHRVVIFRTDGKPIATYPIATPAASADWSPDGAFLVLDTGGKLRVMDADGSVSLIGKSGLVLFPEVSADGQWIYYAVDESGGFEVRRVRPSGEDDARFFWGPYGVALSMSPSESHFTYTRSGPDELVVVTSGSLTQVSLGNGHTSAWSPNGIDLAFVSGGGLWIIDMSTRRPRRQIGSQGGFSLGIDWSPDGKWLVGRAEGGFVLVEAASGLTIPLGFTGGWEAPAWRE